MATSTKKKSSKKKKPASGKSYRKSKVTAARVPPVYANEVNLRCYCGQPATCYDTKQRREACDEHNTDAKAIRYEVKAEQGISEREELAQVANS